MNIEFCFFILGYNTKKMYCRNKHGLNTNLQVKIQILLNNYTLEQNTLIYILSNY